MDEVTYHNLECVYSYLQTTRGTDAMQTDGGNMTTDHSNACNSSACSNTNNQNNFQQAGNASNQYAHLPRIEAQIMGLLDKYQDGVDVNTIMGTLRSVGSQDEIGYVFTMQLSEGGVRDDCANEL
ncbi:UNVERIFIED_CONTAM: hypothetical protein HDU68_000782 [Siphonaria sp. JEL0065]|nr:hypothetical protein HDU68_000782 [Siphonaria sp. JEL0065]